MGPYETRTAAADAAGQLRQTIGVAVNPGYSGDPSDTTTNDSVANLPQHKHHVATLIAPQNTHLDWSADAGAARDYYRLWRLKFYDGSEARGADIVMDRFVSAMESIGREAIVLRTDEASEADWDLLIFQGRFDTAEAAGETYDVRYEEALIDRINDPRIVVALRAELGALTAAEDTRVVYRWVGGDAPAAPDE